MKKYIRDFMNPFPMLQQRLPGPLFKRGVLDDGARTTVEISYDGSNKAQWTQGNKSGSFMPLCGANDSDTLKPPDSSQGGL